MRHQSEYGTVVILWETAFFLRPEVGRWPSDISVTVGLS